MFRALLLALGCVLALTACEPAATPTANPTPTTVGSTPPVTATPTPRPTPSPSPTATPTAPSGLVSLEGNTRNAIAWAPLSEPDAVTVEGSVPRSRAWSTSKVLVIAAYLDTVVDGRLAAIPARERGWIQAALTTSDGEAIAAIK